ncbi:MAG: tRNA (adenosine(37)-N6)-threonylcarbamoyltransferase complex ATPase subunit type 1 TsaE [Planctomycetota bacterium]|nr:tRNA (adenosine(37)-N6)-threonylcarbamoyltransferase complex ATPase subunit type 1 TsaE [Planctomycetota bacterium]
MSEQFLTNSAEETVELGKRLARRFDIGDCVALVGDLGAGKTVFVRGVACGFDVPDERVVSSPTYVLVQEYEGRVRLYHVDLYRLISVEDELADLAVEEMLADGVVVIEWADRAAGALPRPYWQITIEPTGATSRQFTLERID